MSHVGLKRACNVCNRSLPMEDFHRDKTQIGGRRLTCGSCAVAAAKRSRDKKGKRPLTLEQKQDRKGIKLDADKVRRIRKWLMAGWSQLLIADFFNVSSSLIGRIHRREIWKNVPHDSVS